MKRIGILLLIPLLLLGLAACGPKPLSITEEEATVVLKELVPRSYELNVIFFGVGLPPKESPSEIPGQTHYLPVAEDCGYGTVQSIMDKAEQVYSRRYLDGVYVSAFIGVAGESTDGMLDTTVSPRYREWKGELQVDVAANVIPIRGRLQVVSATVGKATPTYVTTEATCLDESGKTVVITVLLAYENGVWLLDSPTY